MPIRKGDGTGIASIRKGDGTGIASIRKGDGTVLWSAGADLPNTAISQWDAQALTGYTDGDSVDPFVDQEGTNDTDTTSGTSYQSSGINGNPAVFYDGTDDYHETNTFDNGTSTPYAVSAVVQLDRTNTGGYQWFNAAGDNLSAAIGELKGEWAIWNGNGIEGGSSDTSPHVFFARFDGSNSYIRVDGTEVVSGDAGSRGCPSTSNGNWTMGEREDLRGDKMEGYIGEIVVHDSIPSVSDEEQRLADKWGITI